MCLCEVKKNQLQASAILAAQIVVAAVTAVSNIAVAGCVEGSMGTAVGATISQWETHDPSSV